MRTKSKRFANAKECMKFKQKIRRCKSWSELKKIVRQRQKGLDPFTKKKLSPHAHLHHLCVNNDFYDELNPDNFMLLNAKTHEFIHFIYDNFDSYCLNKEDILKTVLKMRELSEREWVDVDRP